MLRSLAPSSRKLLLLAAAALLTLIVWDVSGLDIAVAQRSGRSTGFTLRDKWLLTEIFPDGAKRLSWALIVGISLAIWWPFGVLTKLTRSQRVQLVVTTLLAASAVSVPKLNSATGCPWDWSAFSGVPRYASHWTALTDGGSGSYFSAGHGSTGAAFLGGYFVLRENEPGVARAWLSAALVVGLVLGVVQQMRGAHFLSHTLWTAWICWVIAFAVDSIWQPSVRIKA